MIRIVIAEDQEFLLGIIGSLLSLEEDMEVVGQSSDGAEVLALVKEHQPDICIMDMDSHSENDTAEKLHASGCKLMILTTFAKPGYFERIVQMDIKGYLPKDSSSEEFVSSIRKIMEGGRAYSQALMESDDSGKGEGEGRSGSSSGEPGFQAPSDQQNKTLETVRGYLTTFKDKMKLPAG
ncbi:response regulator transcription factor [Rossellomorea vietnamensis]|uniref:Response regulator transcription factor n=1 Tax=Rossellomorea vietnamensis TaxID=218284 RepID=A0A5D4KCF9_9BACI|nr:response regulator [Rossellomorea vietnamensis]TYR74579.1 response regulator transcription factor [Rossellomorea vietnamensis]